MSVIEELLQAAKEVVHEWDTMGWYRGSDDNVTCVSNNCWKDMNYGKIDALREAIEKAEEE